MIIWWNEHLMKWSYDEMILWWNDHLVEWSVLNISCLFTFVCNLSQVFVLHFFAISVSCILLKLSSALWNWLFWTTLEHFKAFFSNLKQEYLLFKNRIIVPYDYNKPFKNPGGIWIRCTASVHRWQKIQYFLGNRF